MWCSPTGAAAALHIVPTPARLCHTWYLLCDVYCTWHLLQLVWDLCCMQCSQAPHAEQVLDWLEQASHTVQSRSCQGRCHMQCSCCSGQTVPHMALIPAVLGSTLHVAWVPDQLEEPLEQVCGREGPAAAVGRSHYRWSCQKASQATAAPPQLHCVPGGGRTDHIHPWPGLHPIPGPGTTKGSDGPDVACGSVPHHGHMLCPTRADRGAHQGPDGRAQCARSSL